MTESVSSPLTNGSVSLVESISTDTIISQYKKMGLDVESYFTGIDEVKIYRCNNTGFRFYYPSSLAAKASFYEELQRITTNYYPIKWEHYKSLKHIQPGNEILDIGCGDAMFLKLIHDRLPNTKVMGLEFNELAIKKAASNGIEVLPESVEVFSQSNKERFDMVTAYQVLEHVTEPRAFLQSAVNILKPGGKLIIGVPNNHPYLYKTDKLHALNLPPHHMGLWSKESLTSLSGIFNLTLIECKTEPLVNTYYYTDYYLKTIGLLKYRSFLFPLLQRFFKYTRHLRTGQCILAAYKKN
jgi:SAM-dependent methyltransferase